MIESICLQFGSMLSYLSHNWSTGFDDIMNVAVAVTAMSRGFAEVDGLKTGSKKYVTCS